MTVNSNTAAYTYCIKNIVFRALYKSIRGFKGINTAVYGYHFGNSILPQVCSGGGVDIQGIAGKGCTIGFKPVIGYVR